jgi:hypothetical protein
MGGKGVKTTENKIHWPSWYKVLVYIFLFLFGKTAKTLIIEDQAFSQSYDMAPPHPLPLSPHQQVATLSQSFCVSTVEHVLKGVRGMGWRRSKKAWSSINHSIFSELPPLSEETARCPYTCPIPLYYKYFFHADKKNYLNLKKNTDRRTICAFCTVILLIPNTSVKLSV